MLALAQSFSYHRHSRPIDLLMPLPTRRHRPLPEAATGSASHGRPGVVSPRSSDTSHGGGRCTGRGQERWSGRYQSCYPHPKVQSDRGPADR